MKNIIIILLLLSPFAYAYYHKPLMENHQEKIYLTAKGANTTFDKEAAELPGWEVLEFVDWKVFSTTRDKTLYSTVSFGLLDRVFVLDDDWSQKTLKIPAKTTN